MSEGSILKDMCTYKAKLLSLFSSSDEICKLLLNKEEYTESDAKSLIYSQIFPYLHTDKAQTEVLAFLCVEADVPKIPTHTVKEMRITVWAYCHKDDMDYSTENYSGTKVDILSDMVERLMRNSDKFGIGKLDLQSVTHFSPQENYFGKEMIFSVPDFKIKR